MTKNAARKSGLCLILALVGCFASPAWAATATRSTSFSYTTAGLLASEVIEPNTPSLKTTTSYTYDTFGNITGQTQSGVDIATRTQATAYDTKGQFATTQTNALNQSETWQYDARFGQPTSHTGPNGLTTTWSYDSFGRKTLEVRPDGTRTSWSYVYCSGINGGTASCPTNGAYLVQETPLASDGTTQNGPVVKTYYDKLARVLGSDSQGFDGSTVRQLTQYDSKGRAERSCKPYFLSTGTQRWTVNTYDALGRVVATTNPDNSVATFGFHGLTTTITNPLNQTTTTVLNAQGKAISVTEAAGTTKYTYDPFGNLKTVTDAAGNVATYTYDVRGNKIAMQDPDLGTWRYTYNVLGMPLTTVDAKNQTTAYTYDLLGRPTQVSEADRTTTYTYDTLPKGVGALASATVTESGATTYSRVPSYDSLGRLKGTVLTIGGVQYTSAATFDSNGRLSTLTYPSGLVLTYTYTSLGYLSTVKNGTATYWQANTRDAEMNLTQQTLGNGVVTSRTYNPNTSRLTAVQAGASNAIANFTYTFDAIGNLTARTDANSALSETFVYDNMNRLTQSTVNSGTPKTVAYNAIGNITNKSGVGAYTYPLAGSSRPHAIQSIAGTVNTSFTYDANGNMLTGNGRSYTYTAANRQKTITSGATTITYNYDDAHQRIRQVAPEGTTVYLNDPLGVRLEKFTGTSGSVQWNEYLYAVNEAIGVRFNRTSGPLLRYYIGDHLGSVSVITNETGAVAERLSYDPWGKRRFANGADDTTNTITSQTTRGFTNHEHISNIGLINMNARTYDPVVGRFLTPDTLIEDYFKGQILNRYSYVGNNPLSFTDPTGQCFLGCFWQTPVFRTVLVIASAVTLQPYITALNLGWPQAIALSALRGTVSSAVITGNLSGSWRGAITAVIFHGIGDLKVAGSLEKAGIPAEAAEAADVAAHGVAGGITSVIQGGQFQSGFLAAGFSQFAGPQLDAHMPSFMGKTTAAIVGGISRGATGGIASVLGGGKFANGAITSSFEYLYNECLHPGGPCTGNRFMSPENELAANLAVPGFAMYNCLKTGCGPGESLLSMAPVVPFLGEIKAIFTPVRAALGWGAGSTIAPIAGRLTGYTRHGLNQAISREGVGVSPRAILDALRNPIRIIPQAGNTTKYLGQDAAVVLNGEGRVVTTFPRSSSGVRNSVSGRQ